MIFNAEATVPATAGTAIDPDQVGPAALRLKERHPSAEPGVEKASLVNVDVVLAGKTGDRVRAVAKRCWFIR